MRSISMHSSPLRSQKEKDGSLYRCWNLFASAHICRNLGIRSTTELARLYLSRLEAPVGESVSRPVELVHVIGLARQHLALF